MNEIEAAPSGTLVESSNTGEYEIRTPLEIAAVLRAMQRQNALVALHFHDSNDVLLTCVRDVDAQRGDLVLQYPEDTRTCARALAVPALLCTSMHEHVKVQFTCQGTRKIRHRGKEALCCNLPDVLVRIQRRETFRISVSEQDALKCLIALPPGNRPPTAELIVVDVSCGGLSLIDHHPRISLEPGAIYDRCSLECPQIGVASFALQVRDTCPYTLPTGLTCRRAGCKFVDISEGSVAIVQRYIFHLERERNARRTGLMRVR